MDGAGGHLAPTLGRTLVRWGFPTITAFGKGFVSEIPGQALIWALKLPAGEAGGWDVFPKLQVSSPPSPSRMQSLPCSCSVPWVHFAAWQQDKAPCGCQHSLFANRVRVQRPSRPVERVHLVPNEPQSLGMGLQSGLVSPCHRRAKHRGCRKGELLRGSTLCCSSLGRGVQTAQLGVAKCPKLSLNSSCSPVLSKVPTLLSHPPASSEGELTGLGPKNTPLGAAGGWARLSPAPAFPSPCFQAHLHSHASPEPLWHTVRRNQGSLQSPGAACASPPAPPQANGLPAGCSGLCGQLLG